MGFFTPKGKQMAVKISPVLNEQQFSDAGVLLSGGKIETYLAGSTTPAATYTTSAGTIAQANPIVLNTRGEVDNTIYLTTGILYKLVLKNSVGDVLRTFDNIEGINDNSSSIDEWINSGVEPTFINATQFSLSGDQTTAFHVNRRVKLLVTAGTVYGYISASVFGALTTVTVALDSGVLDSGLSSVQLGLITYNNSSLPKLKTDQYLDLSVTTAKLAFDSGALGNRNALINGNMAIDQRNAGASQTITAAAALAYTVDRWYAYCTGANVTGQQVAGSAQSQYRYRFTGAASVTKIGYAQRIEAANSYHINNGTATLSVDLANSLLTTVTWTAWYANTADTFGTLASPTRTQIATGTFTVNSTVTRYSTNITIPSAATTGIEIELSVGAQTSGTWTIGNVQLESGSVATPFENVATDKNLASCERYYEKTYNTETVPGTASAPGYVSMRTSVAGTTSIESLTSKLVPKRVTPTIVWYSTVTGTAARLRNISATTELTVNSTTDTGSKNTGYPVVSAAVADNTFISAHFTASAEL